MNITNSFSQKHFFLYPLVQPLITENLPMWMEEEEDPTQTTSYLIYTIHTSLDDSTIDEDTFLGNFLQKQYLEDVKIEGINDDNRSEVYAKNNTELWKYLFTFEIEDPIAKTIEIIPAKTLKINNKLTSQQEQNC
jgi:hypothetical protein